VEQAPHWERRNNAAAPDDTMAQPSEMDEYLFDLKGYTVLPACLSAQEVEPATRGYSESSSAHL
jgi:hypothetical protein